MKMTRRQVFSVMMGGTAALAGMAPPAVAEKPDPVVPVIPGDLPIPRAMDLYAKKIRMDMAQKSRDDAALEEHDRANPDPDQEAGPDQVPEKPPGNDGTVFGQQGLAQIPNTWELWEEGDKAFTRPDGSSEIFELGESEGGWYFPLAFSNQDALRMPTGTAYVMTDGKVRQRR